MKRLVTLGMLAWLWTVPTQADDFYKAAEDLCETIKSCAIKQMGASEITPDMRKMMEPMLAQMCNGMKAKIGQVPTGHVLHDPAVACMRSMDKLGCAVLEEGGNVETAECKKYEELARQQGIEQP